MEHFPNHIKVDENNKILQMKKQTRNNQTKLNWSYFTYIMGKKKIKK